MVEARLQLRNRFSELSFRKQQTMQGRAIAYTTRAAYTPLESKKLVPASAVIPDQCSYNRTFARLSFVKSVTKAVTFSPLGGLCR